MPTGFQRCILRVMHNSCVTLVSRIVDQIRFRVADSKCCTTLFLRRLVYHPPSNIARCRFKVLHNSCVTRLVALPPPRLTLALQTSSAAQLLCYRRTPSSSAAARTCCRLLVLHNSCVTPPVRRAGTQERQKGRSATSGSAGRCWPENQRTSPGRRR